MNKPATITAPAPLPDFFLGVIIETQGIAEASAAIKSHPVHLAVMTIGDSVQQRSITLCKAANEAIDRAAFELQGEVNKLRRLSAALDRKLAAFQARKPRA